MREVGTFSELGDCPNAISSFLSRAPKRFSRGSEFENRLPESMGIVCTSRNSASLHSHEYVFDPEGPGNVACCVRETHGAPKLPEGYRLYFSTDPDAPALRRPDGTLVARFVVRDMTHEALEREALEDLLHTSRKSGGGGSPSPSKRSVGHDLPNTPS